MNLEFLVYANVVLLARFWCLFREEGTVPRPWLRKALFEFAALLALYECGGAWFGAAVTIMGINLFGLRADRARARRDLWQLGLGLLGLGVLSVWFSPAGGLAFRAYPGAWVREYGKWTALQPALGIFANPHFYLISLGLMMAANEANLLIRAAFDWLNLKPRMRAGAPGATELDVGEYNRGRVIGLLERALIYFFVLNGQFGVIGFTLAAKAFTRFKELDDRRFAEYVLIGTLLSSCLAVAAGLTVQWLLAH